MNDTDLYGFSLEKYGFPSRNCGVSDVTNTDNLATICDMDKCAVFVAYYRGSDRY